MSRRAGFVLHRARRNTSRRLAERLRFLSSFVKRRGGKVAHESRENEAGPGRY